MLNLISSVLQQECKQESENLDKGRITDSAPPEKNCPFPRMADGLTHFHFWTMAGLKLHSGPGQSSAAKRIRCILGINLHPFDCLTTSNFFVFIVHCLGRKKYSEHTIWQPFEGGIVSIFGGRGIPLPKNKGCLG